MIKPRKPERVFYGFTNILMFFLIVITLYPMLYVVFCSFSNPMELAKNNSLLFAPAGFSTKGYEFVLKQKEIYIGYANTLFYVVVGTFLNMVLTILGAYALSRKNMLLKKPIILLITFTMFFSGGLIPSYLVVQGLGMINSVWAMIIPSAISTWNLLVMKTSFGEIPESLLESARIDGANEFTVLARIVIPTSMATIAAITLFYAVGRWNEWFSALLYLQDRSKFPLQMFLREMLIMPQGSSSTFAAEAVTSGENSAQLKEVVKYCTIVVSTVPILCFYPFLQKYFVKGVMIGSIKG